MGFPGTRPRSLSAWERHPRQQALPGERCPVQRLLVQRGGGFE